MGLKKNAWVRSKQFGLGRVQFVEDGPTVVVRFDGGLEECEKASLEILRSVVDVAKEASWDVPLEVISRVQALAIRSVNDAWGVFSRSRIELLPHQLWVCKTVSERWPCRWLVADDVGLGKTIEAGLILWPLISRGMVRRLLILCPASLVEQWQERLFRMFDIRAAVYASASDTARSSFWSANDRVIASMQTMRAKNADRQARFFGSEPWDLVVVDEAHHLNASEDGATLGFRLLERLVDEERVKSVVFFTATPHRGKDYGFLSLMHLLRPDLFDPDGPDDQMQHLPKAMIRNNKQNVTDLQGNKLFKPTKVTQETFEYSTEEAAFYDKLTDFIATGRAYASSLDASSGSAVMLVLIAMQKLAASSVAAIRRAIANRLLRLRTRSTELRELKRRLDEYRSSEDESDFEGMAGMEEEIVAGSAELALMENEQAALEELLVSADAIGRETKIEKMLDIIESRFMDRSILIFTEYKATQSLLLSRLMARYGEGSATFINGDGEAREVLSSGGNKRTLTRRRGDAADAFNAGQVRFLVSTEAAGEGIDLQGSCFTLMHADLPWNPMRLHQRVGRLNRYGQKHRVEVVVVHNPSTVESRIYLKLIEKIERINVALAQAMKDPEDMSELVLGMTSAALFRDLYAGARDVEPARLEDWFDTKTRSFGGTDVLETVKRLVGHASRFDFREMSPKIPRVDLPDLKPFFSAMLTINHRQQPAEDDDGNLSFGAPDDWKKLPGVKPKYGRMTFRRDEGAPDLHERLLGVGHKLIDLALDQAMRCSACLASLPTELLDRPLGVFVVRDRVTGRDGVVRSMIVGVERSDAGDFQFLADWELLRKLNALTGRRSVYRGPSIPAEGDVAVSEGLRAMEQRVGAELPRLDHPFRYPTVEPVALLWPG